MLDKVLGLPEFLLGPVDTSVVRSSSNAQSSTARDIRGATKRRGSSPASSGRLSKISAQSSQDFLRAGTSTKSMRLMNTFLDVLRMFANHKFVCFCLEDLHFADAESLDLITQIVSARLKMVIIITHRPEEMSPEKVLSIVQPPESEGIFSRNTPAL